MLREFGHDRNKVTFEVEHFLGKQKNPPKNQPEQRQVQNQRPVITENPFAKDLTPLTAESAADFFNQLGQSEPKQTSKPAKVERQPTEENLLTGSHNELHLTETVSKNVNWNEGMEKMIKRNLLIGNLQYAAEVALKCGRTAEALLIAEQGSQSLFEEIKQQYFAMQKDPFIKTVLQAIVDDKGDDLTEEEALKPSSHAGINFPASTTWQESLSYIFAYELE